MSRTRRLDSAWEPITEPLPPRYVFAAEQRLRSGAREAFIRMADTALESAGLELSCTSGYRSFGRQCRVFMNYAAGSSCEQANSFSARAGHSEHQLGTVCDIALGREAGPFLTAGSAGDRWLQEHAHEFGFANSYPDPDRTQNDGYIHEPWHYRYIGLAGAKALKARGRVAVPVFIASLSRDETDALEADEDSL